LARPPTGHFEFKVLETKASMSVRVEGVASEAQSFSLNDYIPQPVRPAAPAAVTTAPARLTFDLSDTAASAKKAPMPALTFNLTFPKKEPSRLFNQPASDRKLPAGLVVGGGGDVGELVRLKAMLEEGRMRQKQLEKQLDQTEQSVVRANTAITTERKTANVRVAQITSELKASRESEARMRSELANSPALAEARAQADVFKLKAEGAVAIEAEFAAATSKLAAAEAARDAAVGELYTLQKTNTSLQEEIDRTTLLLGQSQAKTDITSDEAVDAVSAHLAEIHQKEVDELAAQLAVEKASREVAESLVPEVQARLEAAECKLAEGETERVASAEARVAEAQAAAAAKVAEVETAAQAKVSEAETASQAMIAAAEAKAAAAAAEAEARIADMETAANARAAEAEQEAQRRVDGFRQNLPEASKAAMAAYETKVALIQTTKGRANAFAKQAAADALHELTTGQPVKRVFHTRENVDRVSALKIDLPAELPRTSAMAGEHPAMHTADHHEHGQSVLDIPKNSMESRVTRAVASIRVDLVGALRERQAHYLAVSA
jgi:hypothetical protein